MPAAGSDDFDKLYKIRPFLEDLKTNFKLQYNPPCEQAVDEAMVKYKGRTSLKQYMPIKPIKRGIKLWCRADSTNGYLCDFDVYTGKQPSGVQHGFGYTVVSKLCQNIKGKWYCVFFDSFVTSCKLIEDLYSDKILCCGTVRQGRKEFPPALFDKYTVKNFPRGDAMWIMKGPILHVSWMDKKAVWVAGTVTSAPPGDLSEVLRRARDGTLQAVTCPPIVSTYNKYMGGVDKNDQMKSYYQISVSGKKWWTRLLFDLIEQSTTALFSTMNPPTMESTLSKAFNWSWPRI